MALPIAAAQSDDSPELAPTDQVDRSLLELNKQQLQQRSIVGRVTLKDAVVESLKIPETHLGNRVLGRIGLHNNGDQIAKIEAIETSCGCTSAIPIERSVAAGRTEWILVDITPKSVGTQRIGIRFRFGGKPFELSGTAKTVPRYVASESFVRFAKSGIAEVVLEKRTNDPVKSVRVEPGDAFTSRFRDGERQVTIQIRQLDGKSPSRIILYPLTGDERGESIPFDAFYTGKVDVFPKRCVAVDGKVRFFLRGDVLPLQSLKEFSIASASGEGSTTQEIVCESKLRGNILMVEFPNSFPVGDHRLQCSYGSVSFPLQLTVQGNEN